ncbi:hypothetical protein LTS08_005266 [Lithohypha guttulata]|nr:hypothetical protein LTS08_005266 [Lithohypha guttulata]
MPVTLRKRLYCHYCGKRLSTTKRDNNKVHCDSCSADNYLDADNNIVDVPATIAARLGTSLNEIESESDIFCKTCLTNQAFYVQALAEYLPEETDSRYKEFERALPEFKRDLDLRYPRCCAQCEPRVQLSIQQANYAAKSDHLRRLMHRKHGRRRTPEIQLRSLLISAAGLGQITGLLMQLAWHAVSSQYSANQPETRPSLHSCLTRPLGTRECADYAGSWVPWSLFIGLLCIWWNPKWQHRLMGKEGRLTGLRKYYVAQSLLIALRFTAWTLVKEVNIIHQHAPAVHTICLGLFTMIGLYSWFGLVRIDTTPLVDWQQVQAPLVSPGQFQPPMHQINSPLPSQVGSQFFIDTLAGPPRPTYEPWRPPTPPPTEDDSMDWAPSNRSFNPQPRIPRQKLEQPNPFHGTFPAAPMRGSLNPKQPGPPPQKRAPGVPPGFFGLSKSKDQSQQPGSITLHEPTFAPARFFAHEREADTGLENIFDRMFSVRDPWESQDQQPKPVPGQQQADPSSPSDVSSSFEQTGPATMTARNQASLKLVICSASVVALAIVASSLCSVEFVYGDTTIAPSTILPYTAVVPVVHVLETIAHSGRILSDEVAVPLLQAILLFITQFFILTDGSNYVRIWNKFVIGTVCFLLLQEVYRFCQLQSTPVTQAAAAHMAQSVQKVQQQHSSPSSMYENPAISYSSAPLPFPAQPSQQGLSPISQQTQQFGHAPPFPAQRHSQPQPFSYMDNTNSVRKRDSDESISSISSIQTTSTAPGWRTPKNDNRTFDWQNSPSGSRSNPRRPASNIARGLGGLSLGNDFSGAGVAGPRARNGPGGGRQR